MAPDFTLPSTIGDKVTLSDYRGKKNVLLLFYPLDFSPTCSKETKQAGEILPDRPAQDVEVLGISVDSLWSHKAFAPQNGITYPLLADFHPKGDVSAQVRRLSRGQGIRGADGVRHRQGREDPGRRDERESRR